MYTHFWVHNWALRWCVFMWLGDFVNNTKQMMTHHLCTQSSTQKYAHNIAPKIKSSKHHAGSPEDFKINNSLTSKTASALGAFIFCLIKSKAFISF